MTGYPRESYVEDIVSLEFLIFIVVLFAAWLMNGCQPLWTERNLAEGIMLAGLLLVFGLLLSIGLSEITIYAKKRS
ncbi:hypothetical protein MUP79_06360 [Candidatus Bathyarchaeota archaeon]|nr:hypothetical protein [Candidatus Bathyarchaeota archaeon]